MRTLFFSIFCASSLMMTAQAPQNQPEVNLPADSLIAQKVARYLQQGDSCLQHYDSFHALQAYQEAVKLNTEPATLRKLAQCQFERGVYLPCLQTLNQLPQDSIGHQDLRLKFQCFTSLGQPDSAYVTSKTIIDRYPYDAQMTVKLAIMFNQQELPDSALHYIERFRMQDSTNAFVNQHHAYTLYQKKQYAEALNEYLKLLAMKADNASICYYTGLCYTRCDSVMQAVHFLDLAAQKENYTNPHVLAHLGSMCLAASKLDRGYDAKPSRFDYLKKGIEYMKKSIALLHPNRQEMQMLTDGLSNAYFYLGNHEESLKYLKQSLEYYEAPIYPYYKMGQLYGLLRKPKLEKQAFQQFVEKAEQKADVKQSLQNLIDFAKKRIQKLDEEAFFQGKGKP